MNQLLICFCLFMLSAIAGSAQSLEPSDFKEIKYGRKDLIRNDLIKTVIESNNKLCTSFVNSYQSDLLTLKKYNDYLENKLRDCKCK